jgi:hypothetical protein
MAARPQIPLSAALGNNVHGNHSLLIPAYRRWVEGQVGAIGTMRPSSQRTVVMRWPTCRQAASRAKSPSSVEVSHCTRSPCRQAQVVGGMGQGPSGGSLNGNVGRLGAGPVPNAGDELGP